MTIEFIRRVVRKRIGFRSPVYRFAARALTDGLMLWREGLGAYRQAVRLRNVPAGGAVPLRLRSLAHPFYVRPGTDDLSAVLNNIVRRTYGQHCPETAPRVLVDAGAYIGDTSVYFLNRFPGLKAYALEPSLESRAIAERNLAPYGNRAELISAALSTEVGRVSFGGQQMGARIGEDGDYGVATTTLPALLAHIPEGWIDILKMDIEGAEHEILLDDVESWLPHVGLLIVETHGPEITDTLHRVVRAKGWQVTQFRNVWYCQPGEDTD